MGDRIGRSYPRSVRLLRKSDFDRVIREGARAANGTMRVRALLREEGLPTRLGVTVGRKTGKAAVRNRLKRLIREAFRLQRDRIPARLDIVVFPGVRKGEPLPSLREIEESLVGLAAEVRERLDRRGPPRRRRPPGGVGGT